MRAVRDVRVAFGVGIALIVAIGALTLTHAPPRVLRVGTSANAEWGITTADEEVCQANETLPAGVSAIRLTLGAYYGSRVRVRAFSGARVLTEGERGPDWTSGSVTVPVAPLSHAAAHVKLCVHIGPNSEPIYLLGSVTPAAQAAVSDTGKPLAGRIGVEYLASGQGSWWSRILSVARHMGVGHVLSGTWVTLLVAALVAAIGVLAVWLALRELPQAPAPAGSKSPASAVASPGSRAPTRKQSQPREQSQSTRKQSRTTRKQSKLTRSERRRIERSRARRASRSAIGAMLKHVPTAAWICALIAFLNAFTWSLIVPPFQGKDEADHFAYVEQLAERGALPENKQENPTYSPEETLVLEGLHAEDVARKPQTPAIFSVAQQQTLSEDVHAGASLKGSPEAGVATAEPPLYYALQVVPYALGSGNVLAQLQLMRLLGALFGALTALLTFLFLREVLPGAPWAATVGALCVALQPLFAFMSGSVNPDGMLFAVTAGVFYCLARAFRRGLTWRLAVVLGALIAVGFVTKLNFVGFAFGVFLGLIVLAVRGVRSAQGRQALAAPAIAGAIGVSPVVLYALRNLLSSHPTFGILSSSSNAIAAGSLFHELGYTWQMYLPRLPGMTHYFVGMTTYKDVWFDRSVGLYGWMDTMFPTWVDNLALIPVAALVLLCARELFVQGDALRARLPELSVYGAIAIGILVMVGASSYLTDVVQRQYAFGEPRYLLPLLPLLGAVITLAVRGGGRRWAPVIGAAMVLLFLGHDIFSQLQVIARYYG